jgi:hypothetical protein
MNAGSHVIFNRRKQIDEIEIVRVLSICEWILKPDFARIKTDLP